MSNHDLGLLQVAIMHMTDGLLAIDLRSNTVVLNPAARHMLGIAAATVVTVDYLKDVVGFYPFELAAGAPVREELRIGDRVLHSVVTPLFEQTARIGATVVLRDLGAGREVSQQRTDFAQLMAHELRTPLTSIAGALELVATGHAGALAEKQLRYVELARQAATRMNQTVDRLLDLARAQAGSIAVATVPVLLDRLVKEVVGRYRDGATAKRIQLDLQTTVVDIAVLGDPERLTQVLGNLLSNAIRFSPPDTRIAIDIFGPPTVRDAIGVSVQNTGLPIPPDERERIFEPFSLSSRRIGGSALGLAISRTIIEAHGGRIWVESDQNATKFVFTLPVQSPAGTSTIPPPLSNAVPRALPDGAAIVIVDADPHRALLLKGVLMSTCERVFTVADADSAIATARVEKPALLIVAHEHPDWRALCSLFAHEPAFSAVATMAIGTAAARPELLAAGADDVYVPPLSPAAFRDACVRLVDASGRSAPRILIVDDDAAIRTICRDVLEQAGYVVSEASNGADALAEARRVRPDLYVLDIMMPELDGYQVAEKLRSDPHAGLAPIIFLSARGETQDKVRAFRAGAEDYLVKPFDAAELVARVAKAIARTTRQLDASPTTQLPGGDAISKEIDRRFTAQQLAAYVCYLDLDNLKAFNDYYGYARANAVIRQTGALLRDVVAAHGAAGDFIGHVAGDDFVMVLEARTVDAVCRAICQRFEEQIRLYYDKPDRDRGHIETNDRFGVQRRFPLMSVSIAAIAMQRAHSAAGVAELAAAGKALAKAITGSSYVRDEAPQDVPKLPRTFTPTVARSPNA